MFKFIKNVLGCSNESTQVMDNELRKKMEKLILHENDRYMVNDDDWEWYKSLSGDKIKNIFETAEVYRMGAFSNEIKSGASSDEAVKSVLKTYPYFYLDINTRDELPKSSIIYSDDDMRLPLLIKKKIDVFLGKNKRNFQIFSEMIDKSTTAHAFYRRLFREGYIQN